MTLCDVMEGKEYAVVSIQTNDDEMDAFLFSLGCYRGERVTLLSRRRGGYLVAVKNSRYHLDDTLARAITVE